MSDGCERPLRVLVWYWGRRGAGNAYTCNVVRALRQRDDVEVFLSVSRQSEGIEAFRALGVPTHWVDTYSGKLSAALSLLRLPLVAHRLYRFLARERIDCVLCTMTHLWTLPMLPALRRSGAAFVLVVHDASAHPGEDYGVRTLLLRREIAAADALVALSAHVKNQLVLRLGFPAERIALARLGRTVISEEVTPPRRYPQGRVFRLLFFGRLLPYKGLDLLVEAFRRLRKRHPDLELRIVGSGKALPAEARRCEGIRVEERWVAEGEIPSLLRDADLVVLPYVEASQSGVVEAAFAAALPSVVTPVGGLAEQIKNGVTGLVASAVDATALADAIERLVTDPELYEACSAGAYRAATSQSDPRATTLAELMKKAVGRAFKR